MSRIAVLLFSWLLLGGVPVAAGAQAPPAPATATAGALQVTLGDSAVDLFGPWRFKTGDDPAWAQPGYDDTGWNPVDLHSPDGPADPDLGTSAYVPGWTALGYPKYAGFAWYRLRLDLGGARTGVSLKMPDAFDDAYQVFVNGQMIGQFGHFGKHRVEAYNAQPRGFRFPANFRNGPVVIAIRMWMDSSTRYSAPDAGGLHEPPVLGLAPTVATLVRLDWDDDGHVVGSGFLELLVLLLALTVSFTHLYFDPKEKAYLWLGLVCIATLLGNVVVLLLSFTTVLPVTPGVLLKDVIFIPVKIGTWVLFWRSWFCLRTARRLLPRLVWALVAVLSLGTLMLRPPLHGQVVPLEAGVYLSPLLLYTKLALAAILIWVAYKGIREDRAEGWLTLPAILLAVAANYQQELHLLHVPIRFSILRFQISLGQASTILSLLLITLMASRRFLNAQRREVKYQLEVEQAGELQQVIIPRILPQVDGLRIESEYRPSRDVGGDFFQIIPHDDDGSVLIIVGDVTGKGLRAGMLVALIVGALDAAAKAHPDPTYVLQSLNDRLCDRGFATATCLVMKITADGFVSIANAGQLSPYLNGVELETEGALPLGTLPGMEYATLEFWLEEGDSLMLMTDGVVEAQNEDGALFGFERTSAMVAARATPAAIATAAQHFGQEDDILVLRVERTASRAAAHRELTRNVA